MAAREHLFRRNAVLEALHGRRRLHRLWVADERDRTLQPILTAARAKGVPTAVADKQKLSNLAQSGAHQGVVLEAGPFPYATLEDILAQARHQGERTFILLLDLIQGPQNVGSLLRTAEACGVHGVVMQERRAPDISPLIVNYTAGAVEHLLVARVTNLNRAIEQLKENDVWIAGLARDETAQKLGAADLDRALGIVVGHEGGGLRRRVRDSCDFLLEIPMRGRVDSLNAAVAGSIALYTAWQARKTINNQQATGND